MPSTTLPPSDALLLITPGCPHCPGVLQALADLVKEGVIGTLEVVNVRIHPERATELGVRTAPWTRVGPFELEGAQTPAALRQWAERAQSEDGLSRYLEHLLATGGLKTAEAFVSKDPVPRLRALLPLVENPESAVQVRLGAGALMEHFEGTEALRSLIELLGKLSRHPDHRVRGDACHYLGLTRAEQAAPYLRNRLDDESGEVREIAADSLEMLEE